MPVESEAAQETRLLFQLSTELRERKRAGLSIDELLDEADLVASMTRSRVVRQQAHALLNEFDPQHKVVPAWR